MSDNAKDLDNTTDNLSENEMENEYVSEQAGNNEGQQDTVPEDLNETDKLRAELSEVNDKYLRLVAEFDNFRRRNAKERIELIQTAGKDIVQALLVVLDDTGRAKTQMENATDIEELKSGISLIFNKLQSILQSKGLRVMESKGQDFDPDIHEAITEIPAPTEEMKGKVIDEIEPGYYLNDKLIRHAKVVVGN